jgi:hypothetical protein
MAKVRYTVTANVASKDTLGEFLEWLQGGHVQELVKAGALSAEVDVVESDSGATVAETTYIFPSREALQAYFDGPAAALREDGKVRWIDTGKISFSRRIATIAFEC